MIFLLRGRRGRAWANSNKPAGPHSEARIPRSPSLTSIVSHALQGVDPHALPAPADGASEDNGAAQADSRVPATVRPAP